MKFIKFFLGRLEFRLSVFTFLLLAFLPVLEILSRLILGSGIKGSEGYINHTVLWVAFLSGMIASREKAHLSLTSGRDLFKGNLERISTALVRILSGGICLGLSASALSFIMIAFNTSQRIGFIPVRLVGAIIPTAFLVMGIRFLYDGEGRKAPPAQWLLTLLFGLFLSIPSINNMLYSLVENPPVFLDTMSSFYYESMYVAAVPLIVLLLLTTVSGTPIFIILGGAAFFLFSRDWGSLEIIPNEAYNLLTGSSVPAIPLLP